MSALLVGVWSTLCGLLIVCASTGATTPGTGAGVAGAFPHGAPDTRSAPVADANVSPVQNFSVAVQRLVTLVAAAGGGLLSLIWARVALSWFSHDSMKKVLAKERARDALVGTLLFVAAITGLVWALAHWVLTGS